MLRAVLSRCALSHTAFRKKLMIVSEDRRRFDKNRSTPTQVRDHFYYCQGLVTNAILDIVADCAGKAPSRNGEYTGAEKFIGQLVLQDLQLTTCIELVEPHGIVRSEREKIVVQPWHSVATPI